ncbi:MAG: Gfo/Idh/MocA family oxidoreductase [Chlamydiales bacterium]
MLSGQHRVALIGAGYWGKNLARNLHEIGVLHAICDRNKAHLERFRDLYPGVRFSVEISEILADPEVTSVMIAAPALQHYTLAKAALLSGKDVFVEKPLCMNSTEGQELLEIAESKGLILMVGHLLHYHPCVVKLKEMIALGEIGKLHYITSNRLNLGSYRNEENALWNFAPHDISVILSLCGLSLPEQVRCTGDAYLSQGVADTTLTTLKFREGIRAHIYVSWLNPFKEQKLTVVGSQGMLVFDDTQPWGNKLLLYRNHVTWTQGNIPVANTVKPEAIDPTQEEPLKNECLHFLKCCEERIEPLTNGKEGLHVLKVLEAAQLSLDGDGRVVNPQFSSYKNLHLHPTATIDPDAILDPSVKVWHYTHIMSGAKLGKNTKVGQNVFIARDVVIGDNVKIQNNVSIYSGVVCEDDVFLGPSMVFTNIERPRSEFPKTEQYASTLVEKGVTVGANATILCGIKLSQYAFIGAGAVVTKSVKPFALVFGNPARQIGWVSRRGEKLDLPLKAPAGERLYATCPRSDEIYVLTEDTLELQTEVVNKESQENICRV